MPEGNIPERIRKFIRDHVSSVEQLEILQYLINISPRMETSDAIAQALYLSPESTERQLHRFYEKRLIDCQEGTPDRYGIIDKFSQTGAQLQDLSKCYRERRVSVINEIFSNPISTLQSFADAFIIKKKGE
jgi:hypothetical protein